MPDAATPHSNSNQWHTAVLAVLPGVLLSAMAALQIYRVSAEGMTPWKGAGFGMFSTVDSQASRFVRVYLVRVAEHSQVLVEPPRNAIEIQRQLDELRVIPTKQRVVQLASDLAALEWREFEREPRTAPALQSALPSDDLFGVIDPSQGGPSSTATPLQPGPKRIAVAGEDGTKGVKSRPVPYDRLRVEVWRTRYSAAENALRAALIAEYELPRGKQDS